MQTIPQFAQSKNITVPILNTWIYRHGLPVIRIGRRIYIQDSDYDAWIDEHKTVASKEQPVKPTEMALPKQCRQSSIGSKMRPIY